MLVTLNDVLPDAAEKGYAVGQFNCVTLEMARGVIEAAEEARSPVIIGPAERIFAAAPIEAYADMLIGFAKRASVPVVVHLDHAYTASVVERAIALGFSSVMFDQSRLPYDENAANVRRMAGIAHSSGCSIEAEIGHVGSNGSAEDAAGESMCTEVADAVRFAEDTGCDALAVAIGTAHGVYKAEPKLDLTRLEEISKACPVPIVLHGGTGLSDEAFQACIARGVAKINIFTAVNQAAARAASESYRPGLGAFELMPSIISAVKNETARLMDVFGSAGRI